MPKHLYYDNKPLAIASMRAAFMRKDPSWYGRQQQAQQARPFKFGVNQKRSYKAPEDVDVGLGSLRTNDGGQCEIDIEDADVQHFTPAEQSRMTDTPTIPIPVEET